MSVKNDISYSEVYNKIKLTKSIDDYLKYGYLNDDFLKLYSNFSVKPGVCARRGYYST